MCKTPPSSPLPSSDDYWASHPELHDVPVYYASALAKKCMAGAAGVSLGVWSRDVGVVLLLQCTRRILEP